MRAESVDEVGHKQRPTVDASGGSGIKGRGSRGGRRVDSIFAFALRWRRLAGGQGGPAPDDVVAIVKAIRDGNPRSRNLERHARIASSHRR